MKKISDWLSNVKNIETTIVILIRIVLKATSFISFEIQKGTLLSTPPLPPTHPHPNPPAPAPPSPSPPSFHISLLRYLKICTMALQPFPSRRYFSPSFQSILLIAFTFVIRQSVSFKMRILKFLLLLQSWHVGVVEGKEIAEWRFRRKSSYALGSWLSDVNIEINKFFFCSRTSL